MLWNISCCIFSKKLLPNSKKLLPNSKKLLPNSKKLLPNSKKLLPNRVADLVKGGGLKPDTLKKPKLLSLLEAVAWIAPS